MDKPLMSSSLNALKPTRQGVIAYAVAAAVIVADQLSKAWILGPFDLPNRGPVDVLPFFRLSMVWNRGVSFGMMTAHNAFGRWILVTFAAVVVVALGIWARRIQRLWTGLALGLVIGGAVGNNIIDRVRFGAVVDFLDFSGLAFPWVFNVADSAISIGVVLLLVDSFLTPNASPPSRGLAPDT